MPFQPTIFAHLAQLANLAGGKPFEALMPGTFTDMHGQTVTFTRETLERLVSNTQAAIAATKAESGEPLGLPIDGADHERGDAAGWIVGIEMLGDVVRLLPRWTELGLDKIAKGLQRLFSCTIDLEHMAIIGGTLTNWPAVAGLQPIELSGRRMQHGRAQHAPPGATWRLFQGVMPDEPLGDAVMRIEREFMRSYAAQHGADAEYPFCYVRDVGADYLLCVREGELMKVAYTDKDGTVTFAGEDEWVRVRMVPVEFKSQKDAEELDMTKEELEKLLAERDQRLVVELRAPVAHPVAPPASPDPATAALSPELSKLMESGALSEAEKSVLEFAKAKYESDLQRAQHLYEAKIAELHETGRVAEFARAMTNGSRGGKALPVQNGRIEKLLLSLSKPQRIEVENILSDICNSGVVDFTERGTAGRGTMLAPVPAWLAERLDSGSLKVGDLSSEIIRPLLGGADPTTFDLSKWQK